MRKMVHYIPRPLLEEICNPDYMSVNFGALLVEVVATVLDHEVGVSLVSLSLTTQSTRALLDLLFEFSLV